jgi:hypothetical protein
VAMGWYLVSVGWCLRTTGWFRLVMGWKEVDFPVSRLVSGRNRSKTGSKACTSLQRPGVRSAQLGVIQGFWSSLPSAALLGAFLRARIDPGGPRWSDLGWDELHDRWLVQPRKNVSLVACGFPRPSVEWWTSSEGGCSGLVCALGRRSVWWTRCSRS